jgi:putative ABC transport system permease protein
MWNATLKGLLAHKLRLAATALAIVLGVGFVAGTYVLTDTITATFDQLFKQVTEGVDVAVRSQETFGGVQTGQTRDPMPASLLDKVKAVDGVKEAEGNVTGFAQFIGKDGKPVTPGGAPTLGVSIGQSTEFTAGSTMREGRRPSGPNEVVVDAKTAEDAGFRVGDRVKVLLQGPAQTFTISGIIGFGEADNLGGATLAGFDLPTAQKVLNREGRFDEIDVAAQDGVSPEQLRDRIRAAVDPKYEVLTGTELAESSAAEINDTIGRFLGTALLAFAFVALLVGGFLIYNTFSIIIAQRTRELALLRCLGASRRQVLGSVLLESVVVAVVASLVGLGLGVLIALLLRFLFSVVFGADLPSTAIQFELRTVVVSLLVGLVVTVLSALLPARKATRVPPVAALQPETAFAPTGFRKRRIVFGVLITAVGVALLLAGLFRSEGNGLINVASGAVVVFFGVAILSPLIARPLARVIGWPFARAFRLPGNLARQNAMRNPRRTASTAAALMIGLALVAFSSIFAASIKSSTDKTLDESVSADYILTNSDGFTPFSPDVAKRLSEQPELAASAGVRLGAWKLNGANKQLYGVDPIAYEQVVRTEVIAGRLADLAGGGLAVKDTVARANGWTVGETVPMQFPRTGVQQVPVRAIYKDNTINGDYLLSLADYQGDYTDQQDFQVYVKAKPGIAPAASRAAVDRVTAAFPNITVRDQAENKAEYARQINQLLYMFYVLLALAVIIALFGIVNTLALSIFERVRELGLLRAIGATRRQLRSMIRWEAVIIAVLGAVLGLAIGVFFGWTVVRASRGLGITEFTLPAVQLVIFVLGAALAGILAAILPGRRAARIDVLRAITTE